MNLKRIGKGVLIGGLVAVVAAGACGAVTCKHWDRETYRVKVTGAERVNKGDDSKYIVFAEDVNTGEAMAFENTDSSMECFFGRCKWDSSNIQSKANAAKNENAVVDIKTYGWRVPFLSWYENIVSIEKVE
ncbi:MAG: DUF1523 family protein [Nanoarchaeota archaeon]|nr:DUF1523 family protein [Nanoarchaeota archaeon]